MGGADMKFFLSIIDRYRNEPLFTARAGLHARVSLGSPRSAPPSHHVPSSTSRARQPSPRPLAPGPAAASQKSSRPTAALPTDLPTARAAPRRPLRYIAD